jgi:hypothetical protein
MAGLDSDDAREASPDGEKEYPDGAPENRCQERR